MSLRQLDLPNEIIQAILEHLPRSSLPQIALVSRQWNITTSPLLYRHIYIRTLHHWQKFISCCSGISSSNSSNATNIARRCSSPPWLSCVVSLVLRPSPKLLPRSFGLQTRGLVTDKDVEAQGYIRIQPVDLDNTGLEWALAKNDDNNGDSGDEFGFKENYTDMDTTIKEAEWLTKVTDSDMALAITKCPRLVYLQASGCSQIGDASMYALASASSPSTSSLHSVNSKNSNSSSKSDHGRSQGMQGLWLDLTRQITATAWMTFVHAEQKRITSSQQQHAQQSQHLHHLDISFCGFVTDACLIKALPLWSASLTHLRLCSLYDISDNTVLTIAEHCPHLRLLHLTRCFKVTNRPLARLASSLSTSLVYLSLAFLNQVNEQGIKHLIYGCPRLRTLDISGTGINAMFKQVILQQWDTERERKQWKKVQYHEEPVLLL